MSCKGCGWKWPWPWPNFRHYPSTYLQGLGKTTRNLRIVDVPTEIRSGDAPNESELYGFGQHARYKGKLTVGWNGEKCTRRNFVTCDLRQR
jgi:hypothetical protein